MMPFLCWMWKPVKGYRSEFGPRQVNTLRSMLARNFSRPHKLICVTDQSDGIDPRVEVLPDWKDWADIPSPSGGRNPSCYRRLRMFHPDAAQWFGTRFMSMDLDVVITGDLCPIVDRSGDFVIYGDTNPRTFYNGSLILMNAGCRSHVWTEFHPIRSPQASKAAGHFGSDQGWISYRLGPDETKWTARDGVYSFKNHLCEYGKHLPNDARVVVFHGNHDPWGDVAQELIWVRRHYRVDPEDDAPASAPIVQAVSA